MKLALLSVAFAALTSAAPLPADQASYASIKLLQCGRASGTAFQIAPGVILTAAHVTSNGPCSIEGVDMPVTLENGALDYALIAGDIGKPLKLRCKEMKGGKTFYAIGFAHARYRMDSRLYARGRTNVEVEGTAFTGMMLFGGGVIPGMSGGPIIDSKGRVVAIVNASNSHLTTALGRSVMDMTLCR
jgi:hypothetical protein